jgi:hypothetical protein
MPQIMSFGSNGVDQVRSLRKISKQLLLCSNETVQNAPKHKFWVQWSGLGAFVVKNFEATSFSERVH